MIKNSTLDAVQDIYKGLYRHELWRELGRLDVLSRYRRSKLGVLWVSISMIIMVLVLGYLYSGIMQRPTQEFIPYLATGFIVWNLISSLIIDGTQAFVANAAAIREVPIPLMSYVYRVIWRNMIIFFYNIPVYVILLLVFQVNPFPAIFLAIPALILIIMNGMWVGLLFGVINVRFRDFSHIVSSIIRIMFFVTPVIWYPSMLKGVRAMLVEVNPFYYFLEMVRAPLLGFQPSVKIWFVVTVITLVGWAITLPVYAKWRNKVSYWV